MAHKRRLVVERKTATLEEDLPEEMGWKDWLLHHYARSWYWVGVLFLDVVIFFEAQGLLGLDMPAAVVVTALAIGVEIFVYYKVWGRDGILGDDQDRD